MDNEHFENMRNKNHDALLFRRAIRGGERNIRKLSDPQVIRYYRAAIAHIASRKLQAKPVGEHYIEAVDLLKVEIKQRNLTLVDSL